MTELMKHVHIDENDHKLYIDGEEFPYYIAEQGVTVSNLGTGHIDHGGTDVKIVHIPVLVEKVTVANDAECTCKKSIP